MAAGWSRRQFSRLSFRSKIAIPVVLLIFAVFCQIVSLATPYWNYHRVYKNGKYDLQSFMGLWKSCSMSTKLCSDIHDTVTDPDYLGGWLDSVRALEVVGILCLLTAAILLSFNLISCVSRRAVTTISSVFCLLSGMAILTGATIFYSELKFADFLDVSFGLAVAAGGFSLIDFVFLLGVAQGVNQANMPLSSRDRLAIYRKKHNYLTLESGDDLQDTDSSDELRDMTGYRNPMDTCSLKDKYERLKSGVEEDITRECSETEC